MEGEEFRRSARALSRAAFITRYPHPFLLVGGIDDFEEAFEFQTGAVRSPFADQVPVNVAALTLPPRVARPGLPPSPAQPLPDGIFAIVKSNRNPYQDRISVGRASSCDIVLPSSRMSKLHAHFIRGEGGTWELRDANSANGTLRNGVPLEQGKRVRVVSSDQLRFGDVDAGFYNAGGLWDAVRNG
jgi:hypothetical protein